MKRYLKIAACVGFYIASAVWNLTDLVIAFITYLGEL